MEAAVEKMCYSSFILLQDIIVPDKKSTSSILQTEINVFFCVFPSSILSNSNE